MEIDEFSLRMNQVKNFIRMYLNEQRNELNNSQLASTEPFVAGREEDYVRCFNVHEQLPPTESYSPNSVYDDSESIEEWHQYQSEPVASGQSRIDAIRWWHANRRNYPSLFKLAMSLYYTKISSCDVERCFSLAGRVVRKDRARLNHRNVRTLILLRDRFSNFGFYKHSPILMQDSDDETDLDFDAAENDSEDYLSESSQENCEVQDEKVTATTSTSISEGVLAAPEGNLTAPDSAM